ncbi:conserved exported hypothetical protein [Methylocella tundrae]|uniref:Glycine zipper domain-containing protein n=1 Tax=Methylocella tundrae TaxID=227605 RepID=A0A4U8Z0P6_METTU|nr:hypothetical protein [Methylocella tundrae]WPP06047.1 hypothetical protein SIN04_09690 [Methylocella tundrae]VFU08635.1 conserved exported protein of unknown function [Methylocella tundrae]VTZ48560.1 conserved exported hypothetical protein [Methylocella tundrae]
MKKIFLPTVFLATSLALAGCGYTPEQRAGSGAAIGGATGAAIGAATGGGVGAALVGGALGAATGAIVGANTRPANPPPPPPGYYPPPPPPRACARVVYDPYGNAFCQGYYGY